MKKILKTLLLSVMVVVSLFSFASCKKGDNTQVKIYVPDGTPALAIGKLLAENKQYDGYDTSYNIVPASSINTVFSANDADLAIMPTISGATLYNKGTKLKLLSTNVFGNLYIVGVNTEADSLEDLKGKIVYTTTGTTIALVEYLLGDNNYVEGTEAVAEKVALSSKSDGSEIIPLLKTATGECYGVLGEPQVTKAKSLIPALKTVVDLQAEYTTKTGYDKYPQASLFATEEFCTKNAKYIEKILNDLSDNLEYLKANYTNIPTVMATYESSLKNMTFTADTITNCNFGMKKASEVKDSVKQYCTALKNITLDDGFFY